MLVCVWTRGTTERGLCWERDGGNKIDGEVAEWNGVRENRLMRHDQGVVNKL